MTSTGKDRFGFVSGLGKEQRRDWGVWCQQLGSSESAGPS